MYLSDLLGKSFKEDMTIEDVSKALEALDLGEVGKLKKSLSDANTEAANLKRQLREKQSADERAANDQKEAFEKLTQENAELKRNIALTEKTAKFLAMGYDESLAKQTATAMVDGDMDTVIANQSVFLEAQKKTLEAGAMRNTPRPQGGEPAGGTDYMKMYEEATAEGNYGEAAYYFRLAQEQK